MFWKIILYLDKVDQKKCVSSFNLFSVTEILGLNSIVLVEICVGLYL